MHIDPRDCSWVVQGPSDSDPEYEVPSPLADQEFLGLLRELRNNGAASIRIEGNLKAVAEQRELEELARRISDRITAVFSAPARQAILRRLNQVQFGRARLTVRVADRGPRTDQALALPWELLAPDLQAPKPFPVRQGVLEVVREAVVEASPELPPPATSLAVAVMVSAPEDQAALDSEKEELRLETALAPLGHAVAFSDLGTLDALIDLVDEHQASAILFSGHGVPGRLLFEDELGFSAPVEAEEVLRRLRTILLKPGRGDSFPRVFFLSSCHGATAAGRAILGDGPSTAATLHRAGFPQVVGYFGSILDSQAARAEAVFFSALARGETALQAAHEARASLIDAFEIEDEKHVYPLGWTQLAVYHRGPDRPMALPRKAGRALPPRFRRRREDWGCVQALVHGFIGRRGLQHEVLRRIRDGERLIVLYGPGGLGKTVLACQILRRGLAREPSDRLVLCPRSGEDADLSDLRSQVELHRKRHGMTAHFSERKLEDQPTGPGMANAFSAEIRALQRSRPGLVVYVDRLDAVEQEAGEQNGSTPMTDALWQQLRALSEEGTLVFVTTRILPPEIPPRSCIGVTFLNIAESLRIASFMVELADLPFDERGRLVEWAGGHPLTLEILDRAIDRRYQRLGLGHEIRDPWNELVEPVIKEVSEQILVELNFEALWRNLPDAGREHARCLVSWPQSMTSALVDGRGDARDLLIRRGFLVRERRKEGPYSSRWMERWGLLPRFREVIRRDRDKLE